MISLQDELDCPFEEGQLISCYIGSAHFVSEGKIHYENKAVYICQNVIQGQSADEKYGYKFSWYVCGTEKYEMNRWKYGCDLNNVNDCVSLDKPKDFKVGDEVEIIDHFGNFSGKDIGYKFTIGEYNNDGNYCREIISSGKGVHQRSLQLIRSVDDIHKSKDMTKVITRAVKENDPNILFETGLNANQLADRVVDSVCLISLGSYGGCVDLDCTDDNCPFDRSNRHSVDTAKQWIFGHQGIPLKGSSMIPKPCINIIVNKEKFFKEQKNISLEDLLSSV